MSCKQESRRAWLDRVSKLGFWGALWEAWWPSRLPSLSPPLPPRDRPASEPAELDVSDLRTGDVIRHRGSSDCYIVAATFGKRATAIRTVDVTNNCEWRRVLKPNYKATGL